MRRRVLQGFKKNKQKNVEGHENKKRTEPDSKQDAIDGPMCCSKHDRAVTTKATQNRGGWNGKKKKKKRGNSKRAAETSALYFLFVEETLAATLIHSLKRSLTLKLALCVGFQSYYCHGGSLQDNKRAGGRLFSLSLLLPPNHMERPEVMTNWFCRVSVLVQRTRGKRSAEGEHADGPQHVQRRF